MKPAVIEVDCQLFWSMPEQLEVTPPGQGRSRLTDQYASRAMCDKELLDSVFNPRDGQYLAVEDGYPGALLRANHRRYELLRRAEDPNSEITWETPIFITNWTGS